MNLHPTQKEQLVLAQPGFSRPHVPDHRALVIVLAGWFLVHNTLENMRIRGIQSGFDFLTQPAGFDIGESLSPFDSAEPYWKAFLVGLTNTLRVAIIGIILTTVLGTCWALAAFRATRWCAACAMPMSSSSATCRCCCNC
jgi:ABC-type amino acid transport system permease subunit